MDDSKSFGQKVLDVAKDVTLSGGLGIAKHVVDTQADTPSEIEPQSLKFDVPENDLKLDSSVGANTNVSIDKEILDMDKLSLSNPTKYLATYKSPHDWILDQREAETMQILRKVAEPEQASQVGTLSYSAGETFRKTANMLRDFAEFDLGTTEFFLPNADKEEAIRAYNNVKKLSVQTEQNRAEYVSKHGVDPDVYGIGTNVMEVARDVVLTAGLAGGARASASKAVLETAAKRSPALATRSAVEKIAAEKGAQAASRTAKGTIAGTTFVREAGDRSTQQVQEYMDATGDYDLKYYDPTVDLQVNIGVSAINSLIEMSLGIERVVPDMLFGKRSAGRIATEFIKGYIGERSEEFLQNMFDQGGDIISGYRTNLDIVQAWKDSAPAGWIGGVFGSGTSAGMYFLNRRRMIRMLEDQGVDKNSATDFVDKYMQDGINKTLSNISSTIELRTKNGPAYEKMKAGIKSALLLQGWNERIIDPATGKPRNIDEYVELFANSDMANIAIREALSSHIPIDKWLDVAQFRVVDNVLAPKPLGTTQEIQDRIDAENAIIKRQTELKKTGAGDDSLLQGARMRKNILEKMKLNKLWDDEVQKASVREATTPEVQREIDTANTDAESLGKATNAAEFSSGLEGKTENGLPLTSEQTAKRLGNAVIQRIFGKDKSGFNSVMALPEYANARSAITSSADKIFDYTKKHRTYNVNKDIRDALNMMKTVNAANFVQKMQTPDFSGEDHIARNAFLYQFIFNDPATISSFIDAYLIRAEESVSGNTKTSLSKKDLVGQAFKATDDLMQTQANAAGIEYNSIYNEDGSVADKNVAAVFTSYMNQFVADPKRPSLPKQVLEQFDLANENARLDEQYPEYTGDTIEVDGKVRTVYNSEGKRINKSAEALTNFWRWFGDSKVVDEQGRPLVVYHGTNARFDTFDARFIGSSTGRSDLGLGFYFSDKKTGWLDGSADWYGNIIMPVYLKMDNPFVVPKDDLRGTELGKKLVSIDPNIKTKLGEKISDKLEKNQQILMRDIGPSTILNLLLENKYDGVISDNEYVVHYPNQIKSVENLGYYSPTDSRMLYQTDNPTMIEPEDIIAEQDVDSVIQLFENNENPWGTLIDPVKYKAALEDFVKNGQLLRTSTSDVESWFEIIVRNTAILEKTTELSGHTGFFPFEEVKDYYFADEESYNDFLKENNINPNASDYEIGSAILEKKGFYKNMVLPDGSDAISDYGLSPLWNIIQEYKPMMPAEDVLVLINRALDIYHQRGDLASAFIKGGTKTATAISEGAGFDKLGNQLYSLDWMNRRNKLVVTHGLTLDKLEKALKLGGLPVPSLAISRADAPLDEFGGIQLVGTKDMIDPTDPRNAVFDRDVWSQRVPQPTFKNASIKKTTAFRKKFGEAFANAGETTTLDEILYTAANSSIPGEIIDRFSRSAGAELYYIENVLGKKIEVPMIDKYSMAGLAYIQPDQKFLDEVSKIDTSVESYEVWGSQFKKAVNELIDRGGIKERMKQGDDPTAPERTKKYYEGLREFQVEAMIGQVKDYLFRNEKVIDRQELSSKLLEYDLQNSSKYQEWTAKQTEELLGEPMVQVGNKRLPWNAENITKAMISNKIIGEEKTLGVTVGKVIASGAKRFKSIEEIREAGRQLKTPEMANSITDKAGNKVTRFAELVLDFVGEDNRETVYNSLTMMTALDNPTTADIKRILERELGQEVNLDEKLLRLGVDMVKEVKRVVRSYFEAKPQRIVDFSEFVGAIIPEHMAFDDVADQLEAMGLTIARTQDTKQGLDEIISKRDEVAFQGGRYAVNGFFDPQLSTILLGKNFNTMTLPHEMAHYWLETIFTMYKRVQAGELKANEQWIADKKAMFDLLGISENQLTLTHNQQEKFATMVEAYLTGIGINKDVPQTFKEYLKWVPEKYRSLQMLAYVDDQGKLQNVFLDAKAVEFFNKWYANPSLPSLSTSPERQRFMNVTGDDDKVIKVSIKEMNDREKEFAQDAEEQIHTDERLYNTLDENMPADIKPTADAQKVVMAERGNFLKTAEEQQKQVMEEPKRRWFERKSRETEAQKAQEYIEKNPEHAMDVIYGDPELIPNDTGVDRATLINTYMAMNNITPDKPEWATLHTNIAINQSLAGTQLALSNDKSYAAYLDSLREIENALELKAATNYAGSKIGARERFNADIQSFLDRELPAIFATEPDTKEREMALRMMFEKARTTFSGNTTGPFLNQVDINYAKAQRTKTDAFVRWAMNQIKKDAGAKLNSEQQAKLLEISAKAQQALEDIDNRDAAKAVAAAQELRKWQLEKQKMMGVSAKKWSLFGDWAPRAMLASFNTLVVANLPSTAMNTLATNVAKRGWTGGIFGENNVSEKLIKDEIKRIKAIYGATSMNLAQMEKPTSPSLLHGEKYSASGQKWYDPYTILGREDNFFRVPTFVNTLARIASTDAKATGRNADEVFMEYLRLNNQSDAAKLARKQALAVANMAVFTQNGALASCLNHIRSELNKLSRVIIGLEPQGFGMGNLIAPFLTTGANIAEMGIRGSLAPITTITSMVQSWRTGKAIDPMKRLALRMDWTYFVLSAVSMALLAALTSDDDDFYAEPYRTGMKYDPNKPYDSINLDGVWLDLDFFGPFAIPIRTAAKVIQAWKKDNGIGEGLLKGYAESAKSVLGDIPLAESIINNQFNWATRKPGSFASSYLYTQANKLVPAQIKPISRLLSRGQGWEVEGDWMGPTIQRKFKRNYGFDGEELTTQDLIDMFTIKFQLDNSLNQEL